MIKIPPHAKKVFEGVIYDVYQWEQETFNGEIHTYEALSRPDVVIIIAVKDDEIVLAREEQAVVGAFFSHFGGFIDDGETPLGAAKRELKEEAGFVSASWSLLHIYDHPGKVQSQSYIFLAKEVSSCGVQQLDSGERIESMYVSWSQWLELLQDERFRGREEIASLILTAEDPLKSQYLKQKFFNNDSQS